MELTAEMVEGFAGACLSKRYDGATPTPECHKEWWKLCCSDSKLVAIAAPRSHGKSTAISHAYLLSALLFRERSFAVIVSDTETQAQMFLSDIKEELKNNEDIIQLFQIESFVKDSQTDIIVKFADGGMFRVMCRGAEQRVRGLKWDQKRPDLILCDDLEGDEQVLNKDRREKFRRWFYGALLPCRSRDGIVRVVGTILHLDSLLNRLMPPEYDRPYTTFEPLKTYSTRVKTEWKSVRYRAHSEDFEQILWDKRYDKDYFKKLRDDYVKQGIPEVYSQEYLNYPIDESTAYFKRVDFVEIPKLALDAIKHKEKKLIYYAAVDFAISTKERSDYTVIAIGGVDSEGIMHIVDIRRGRWDALDIVEEMFAVQKKYEPYYFVTEKGSIEKAIGAILNREQLVRNVFLNLYPMAPTKDKQSRARSFQARFRAGGVKFDKTAQWYPELEEEMVRFPKARHDDQVDALSWLGLIIDHVRDADTPEEEEEYEYQMMIKEQPTGRNATTGY
ncbi:terminase large subunit [Caudoviricetes sp.]|nr:terminase large subunit [Caudoviricetes sp.]